jgi:hypothetical protein
MTERIPLCIIHGYTIYPFEYNETAFYCGEEDSDRTMLFLHSNIISGRYTLPEAVFIKDCIFIYEDNKDDYVEYLI